LLLSLPLLLLLLLIYLPLRGAVAAAATDRAGAVAVLFVCFYLCLGLCWAAFMLSLRAVICLLLED